MRRERPVEAVIIDRHEVYRRGLKDLLEETGEFVVVAEAGSVAAARRILETQHPDVSAIDLGLPDGDGLQLVRECRSADASTACVLLGDGTSRRTRLSALLVGAAGVVDRAEDASVVVDALRTAARGRRLFGEGAVEELLAEVDDDRGDRTEATLDHLTPQETRVFELVGQGLTNRDVGAHLFLTEKTVKNYVSRVLTKLGMTHRTEIVALATRIAVRRDLAARPTALLSAG